VVRIRRHAVIVTAVVLAAAGWAALPVGSGSTERAGATTTPPSLVTIKIPRTAFFGSSFQPATVTLAQGGTLRVRNNDNEHHSVTSNRGYFSTTVQPGQTVRVGGVSRLPAGRYGFHCIFHTNMKGTLIIKGSGGSLPSTQLFKQPLVVPPTKTAANISLPIKQTAVRVMPSGNLTKMWTYGNTYPGPTIVRPAGADTKITFTDRLPKADGSFSVHLHGDHHTSANDGQPTTHLIGAGHSRTYDYPLTDGGAPERGSTFIYHDHRMMRTGRHVWHGQEGLFIVTDPAEAGFNLPSGPRYDVPLLISDRSFTSTNQLTNPFDSESRPPNDVTVGNKVLVDGRFAPYLNVDTHKYRLRIVNGSNFQSYNFKLSDGRKFTQIGSGDGLLPAPVQRSSILLGPFERADVVVDFAGELNKNVVLKSVPRTDARPAGSVNTPSVPIMQFRVKNAVTDSSSVPATLEPAPTLPDSTGSFTWKIGFDRTHHHWTINGRTFNPSYVSDTVPLNATQEWKIVNNTNITHYIHLHEEQWQTVRRDGGPPPAWELGIQDTWKLDPGESIVVKGHFTDYTGLFMIHCHMLDHEDHGLMAQFDVTTTGAAAAPARGTRNHRMAGMHQPAVNMAMSMPMHGDHAPTPTVASPGGTPFVKKFLERLVVLLLLAAVGWSFRSGRAARGAPSPG
jgi:FtsP/CotA-like multicopper oxidase with cupredoxin domain/plastocyanin